MKATTKKLSQNDIRGWGWSQFQEDFNQDINLRRFIQKKLILPQIPSEVEQKAIKRIENDHKMQKQKQNTILIKRKMKKMPIFPQKLKTQQIEPFLIKQNDQVYQSKPSQLQNNKIIEQKVNKNTQYQFAHQMKKSQSCNMRDKTKFNLKMTGNGLQKKEKKQQKQSLNLFSTHKQIQAKQKHPQSNQKMLDIELNRKAQKILKRQIHAKMALRMNCVGITSNKFDQLDAKQQNSIKTARQIIRLSSKDNFANESVNQPFKKRALHKIQTSVDANYLERVIAYHKQMKRTEGSESINLQFNDKMIFQNKEMNFMEDRLPSLSIKLKSLKYLHRTKFV